MSAACAKGFGLPLLAPSACGAEAARVLAASTSSLAAASASRFETSMAGIETATALSAAVLLLTPPPPLLVAGAGAM